MHEYWQIAGQRTVHCAQFARQMLVKYGIFILDKTSQYWQWTLAKIRSNLPLFRDRLSHCALRTVHHARIIRGILVNNGLFVLDKAGQYRQWTLAKIRSNLPLLRDRLSHCTLRTVHYTRIIRGILVKNGIFVLDKTSQYWQWTLAKIRSNLLLIRDRLYHYALLIRLDKPIGIFLLLWPTLWAMWIAAGGIPDPYVFTVFVLGVILMRSGGCVINDLADRKFDGAVQRTRSRQIVAGFVKPAEALGVAAFLITIAFLLVMTLNRLTMQLSVVGILLAAIYPYMKRVTYLPQFFLGLAFGWGVPMVFAAQTGTVPQIAWLIYIANVLWSVVYDTIYAMVDRDDDLRLGIKSTAILFDDADRVIIGGIQVLLLVVLILIGRQSELGGYYFSGIAGACVLAMYQQYLIRDRQREGCMHAFQNNNWFGAIVFLGIFLDYLF